MERARLRRVLRLGISVRSVPIYYYKEMAKMEASLDVSHILYANIPQQLEKMEAQRRALKRPPNQLAYHALNVKREICSKEMASMESFTDAPATLNVKI